MGDVILLHLSQDVIIDVVFALDRNYRTGWQARTYAPSQLLQSLPLPGGSCRVVLAARLSLLPNEQALQNH